MPNRLKYYSDPEIARIVRNTQRKKNYQKTAKYEMRRYTPEEDQAVLDHNIPDRVLSSKIQHSVQSIQIRRSRLKKRQN